MNYLKLTTYRAGLLQAKAYRNLSAFMTSTLAEYGLAMTEWAMLGLLKENGPLRPTALSDELGVKAPLISRHIKQLSEQGWVERSDVAADARGAMVRLTPAGEDKLDEVEHKLRVQMRGYLKGVSLRQLGSYIAVLELLADRSVQ